MAAFFKVLLRLFLIAICIAAGAGLASCSFDQLRKVRQLERVPESKAIELLPGEAKTKGQAAPYQDQLLQAPFTNTACVYYIELIERKETDSDGDTRWVTEKREVQGVDFLVRDDTGAVLLLDPEKGDVVKAQQKYSRTEGDMRYTEYRIDPGDQLFVSGYIVMRQGEPAFSFTNPGDYVPMVSSEPELEERRGMAMGSIVACGFAVAFWSVAMMFLCSILRIHLSIVFFTLQGFVIAGSLVWFGLHATRLELVAAQERIERIGEVRLQLLRDLTGDPYVNWQTLPSLGDRADREGLRGRAAIISYAQAVSRFNTAISAPPESIIALVGRIPRFDPPKLDASLKSEFEKRELAFQPTRIWPIGAWIMIGASVVLALVFSKLGFSTVIRKRLIENIPTTKTAGVTYGLNELVGTAVIEPPDPPLQGPLSNLPCVHYHYVIKEKRGSGKKARWVTIRDEKRETGFLCRDAEGEIAVLPEGAEILASKSTRKREGRRIYTEKRIEVGDKIYLLGAALLDEESGDHLVMRRGEDQQKMLLSNLSEVEVLLHKARVAFAWMTAAMNCASFGALALFALIGGLNALTYGFAALGPAIYALLILGILMFNDLVFLRQRTRSTWSNIEVALKKRFDLFDQLQRVASGMIAHEKEVQTKLAQLRGEQHSGPGILALREAYPELQTSELAMQISGQLTRVENEIALMREGYNNAVERYNTRRTHFPEILFAKVGQFAEAPFWSGDAAPNATDGSYRAPIQVA